MRIYGEDCKSIIEIAYHQEHQVSGNWKEPVLHYHKYDGLKRSSAKSMTDELMKKYEDYLKH